MSFAETLKGQRVEAAERLARISGYEFRIVPPDAPIDEWKSGYNPGRVSVRVANGRVTDARHG